MRQVRKKTILQIQTGITLISLPIILSTLIAVAIGVPFIPLKITVVITLILAYATGLHYLGMGIKKLNRPKIIHKTQPIITETSESKFESNTPLPTPVPVSIVVNNATIFIIKDTQIPRSVNQSVSVLRQQGYDIRFLEPDTGTRYPMKLNSAPLQLMSNEAIKLPTLWINPN